jgi:hypothetical protein
MNTCAQHKLYAIMAEQIKVGNSRRKINKRKIGLVLKNATDTLIGEIQDNMNQFLILFAQKK